MREISFPNKHGVLSETALRLEKGGKKWGLISTATLPCLIPRAVTNPQRADEALHENKRKGEIHFSTSHVKNMGYTLPSTGNIFYAKQIQGLIQCQKELGMLLKVHI